VPDQVVADAIGPWVFSLVVFSVVAVLIFWLVRDRTSSLRFGIFLEHRREEKEKENPNPSEQPTKIQGPWPGEKGGR